MHTLPDIPPHFVPERFTSIEKWHEPLYNCISVFLGDRILSVNGKDCRDLEYGQVIDYLRQIPRHVEMRVLQDHPSYL